MTTEKVFVQEENRHTIKQINPYLFRIAEDDAFSLYDLAAGRAGAGVSDEERKAARNALQLRLLTNSDDAAARHLAGILSNEDLINIGSSGAALTLDALAASFTPVNTKTALSAFSGVATGFRGLANEELYHNAFGPAIVKAIYEDRRHVAIHLRAKRDTDISAYSVDQALHDAMEYHERGSFYYGLALLQQQTYRSIQNQKQTNDQLEEDQGVLVRSDVGQRLKVLLVQAANLPAADRDRALEVAAAALSADFQKAFMNFRAAPPAGRGSPVPLAFSEAMGAMTSAPGADVQAVQNQFVDALKAALPES